MSRFLKTGMKFWAQNNVENSGLQRLTFR